MIGCARESFAQVADMRRLRGETTAIFGIGLDDRDSRFTFALPSDALCGEGLQEKEKNDERDDALPELLRTRAITDFQPVRPSLREYRSLFCEHISCRASREVPDHQARLPTAAAASGGTSEHRRAQQEQVFRMHQSQENKFKQKLKYTRNHVARPDAASPRADERAQLESLLSVAEFAELAPAAVTTVYTWIASRRIESVKLGRRVFVPFRELLRLRDEGRRPLLKRPVCRGEAASRSRADGVATFFFGEAS